MGVVISANYLTQRPTLKLQEHLGVGCGVEGEPSSEWGENAEEVRVESGKNKIFRIVWEVSGSEEDFVETGTPIAEVRVSLDKSGWTTMVVPGWATQKIWLKPGETENFYNLQVFEEMVESSDGLAREDFERLLISRSME